MSGFSRERGVRGARAISMNWHRHLHDNGWFRFEGVLTSQDQRWFEEALARPAIEEQAIRKRDGQAYAVRNLLQLLPDLPQSLQNLSLWPLIQGVAGIRPRPVRAILFDKVPGANWSVSWHQDVAVPVKERKDVPGFSAWSRKAGVLHANAPAEVLSQMIALRIHLDDCGEDNAPLRVLSTTHRHGVLSADQISRFAETIPPSICTAKSGDVLAMRPLLLHASSPALRPEHRRVVHVELAGCELPGGLEWGMA